MLTSADRALAQMAAQQHGVFTIAQAAKAGLSHRQIDRRSAAYWERIFDGVFRMPGAVPTWRGDLRAACWAAEAPAAVSHRAAAALYELPGRLERLEISCCRWARSRRSGIVVHESTRLESVDIDEVDGIPVVTPERLILELAGIWPSPNFIEKVIQAMRRKKLVTYASTVQAFDRLARRGVKGVQATRVAIARWDPTCDPTESDMETLLVQVLREHGLPEPVPQFKVRDEYGNLIAEADAGLPQWKITFEYQSKQEHSNEFQLLRDDRRRNAIMGAGYYPLSARYEDLRTGGRVLMSEVRRIIRRQAS